MPPFRKSPFRTLKRLISRAGEDWCQVVEELFGSPDRASGPRPLRVMRLEKRRVLSADFSFVGGGLLLDGFDGPDGDSLAIVQDADDYQFTTDGGWSTAGPSPEGVTVDGDTLSVDRGLLESLTRGITVADNDATPLSVSLGQADFSGLAGPVSLLAPASIQQQSLTTFVAPEEGLTLAPPSAGLTISSLSVSGDLNFLASGSITDTPGAQILVTGDATFTTRDDGTGNAGIYLADTPGDRFEVGGRVTFDGLEGAERWDINVGSEGWTEFGAVTALGGQVTINESATTTLEQIDATDFSLTTAGVIDTTAGATIDVTWDASLTSTGSRHRGDFDGNRVVDAADRDIWAANYGLTTGADRSTGDANRDGTVDAADYTLWRDDLELGDLGGGIEVSVAGRFAVGGQAELIAADGADRYDIRVADAVEATFGSLAVTGASVIIYEDAGGTSDGSELDFVETTTFTLTTDGPVTDSPLAEITSTDFTVNANGAIVLADDAGNRLAIGDLATLHALSDGLIDVGVDTTTGDPADSTATIGRIEVQTGGPARVALDGDVVFTGINEAASLSVHATGSVLDEPSGTGPTAEINVTGDASFYGAEGIVLGDSQLATNAVVVGGLLRLEAGAGNAIDFGIRDSGSRVAGDIISNSAATTSTGTLTFVAPGGDVRIALDGPAVLTGTSQAAAASLLSTDGITDAPMTTVTVTGDAWFGAVDSTFNGQPITLGDSVGDQITFGSFASIAGDTAVTEHTFAGDPTPGTHLKDISVSDFTLNSAGPITDDANAAVLIGGEADFTAIGSIVLADTANANNLLRVFGHGGFSVTPAGGQIDIGVDPSTGDPASSSAQIDSMSFSAIGGDARVALDGDATFDRTTEVGNLAVWSSGSIVDTLANSVSVTGDASFTADADIRLADANTPINVLDIDGLGSFTVGTGREIDLGVVPTTGLPADSLTTIGMLTFSAPEGDVQIALDGDLLLQGTNEAQSLALHSSGDLLDKPDTTLRVTGPAELIAQMPGGGRQRIILGDSPGDVTAFGSLKLTGSEVAIQEDTPAGDASPGTLLTGVLADTLTLASDGPITDDTGASIVVLMNADLTAGSDPGTRQAITLDAPTVEFGTLKLFGSEITVTETTSGGDATPGTALTGVDAQNLTLTSAGPITDVLGATIAVSGSALLTALGPSDITLDNESVNFGEVGLVGDDVLLREASSTLLTGVTAATLDLHSTGTIEDTASAVVEVTSNATLFADEGITLADNDNTPTTNRVTVGVQASFEVASGNDIRLGVNASGEPATAYFAVGTLNLVAPSGAVVVSEDTEAGDPAPGTELSGLVAGSLDLHSVGSITDTPAADLLVTGDALVVSDASIVLANDDQAATLNSLVVDGNARFEAGMGETIDLGVNTAGSPAEAIFRSGTLSFSAPNGTIRIAEDAAALLARINVADHLELSATGSITDLNVATNGAAAADTTIQETAVLIAGNGGADIVLGDQAARFSMGTPAVFSQQQYLEVTADNVSIQADSGVNVRAAEESISRSSGVRGTFHLTAEGSITQVHRGPEAMNVFSAERVSLSATHSVYFDSLRLDAEDSQQPNLQVEAGTALRLSGDLEGSDSEGRYDRDAIPDDPNDRFAPVVVEVDSATGQREDPQGERFGVEDGSLENVVVDPLADPKDQQFTRLDERNVDSEDQTGPFANDLADDYSVVVQVKGSAIVGDVADATEAFQENASQASRGLVVNGTGNAYLGTTDALTFSGVGRFDSQGDNTGAGSSLGEATVVELAGGVLTAIAGTSLAIVTDDPNEADPLYTVTRTTKLKSSTGTVTALADPAESGQDAERGPRVIVDEASDIASASTTGIVRADTDFEQRITVALGSRGEDNLLVEVEWADVANIREDSNLQPVDEADRRSDFSPTLPGANPIADVIQTPQTQIESAPADPNLTYGDLADDSFRTVTIRHNFAEEFIPILRTEINRDSNRLPTTVRVFNDPAINLFENGGETDLNSAAFDLAPQIISQQGGFYLLSAPDRPTEYVTPEIVAVRSDAITTAQRTLGDDGRAAVVSSAETVEFGRVDRLGEWLTNVPGEEWPQFDDDAEGDFLREIREKIDQGPYSEGRYQIRISTPRGEQLLEEWTKRDLNAEEMLAEPDAAAEETGQPEAQPADLGAAPVIAPQTPRSLVAEERPAAEATQAAFAAMAAVGAWRQRLGERGGFTLDSDGVGFTRVNRRRRKPRS